MANDFGGSCDYFFMSESEGRVVLFHRQMQVMRGKVPDMFETMRVVDPDRCADIMDYKKERARVAGGVSKWKEEREKSVEIIVFEQPLEVEVVGGD